MNKITSITIGADPEVFLETNDGKPKSAIGIIGGTKDKPIDIGNGCALQEDNVMAEFCVPPAITAEELNSSIEYALMCIQNKITPLNLKVSIKPSLIFDFEQLNNFQAQLFG